MADALLPGLRIVEIGQYVAAPFAATLLADQGAEVVKIERPGGDPYRRYPGRWAAWNRGKTSVVLDLATGPGRDAALELIDGADVVVENLRPGALGRLGVPLDELRARHPRLVTCSITAYGSDGPSRDDPGWEPLVHARAGAQQGLFTGDEPIWLPFPMASVAAGLLAVLGIGAALVKRETTGYGQHVETSLFEALLFLNGGAILHRPRRRNPVVKARTPVLHTYATRDERAMQVNLSGTERWRELCRLLELDGDGGLDFSDPASLANLNDRAWCDRMLDDISRRFGTRTADEWEQALLATPAAVSKCSTLEEWRAHEQARANGVWTHDGFVASPVRVQTDGHTPGRRRRHGGEHGALAGHRVVDLSSFWAGPLAARLVGELGAEVIKVQPPGGEGAFQLVPVLPNIYVDGNRSKTGITLDLRTAGDRERLLDLVRAADVVVENSVGDAWERLGLDEARLRAVNPDLVYARAKGFGLEGPLATRPSFDYVVQAATGMVMTQGGGRPQPMNFTANDYGTGLHLAVGIVLALLARARGAPVTTVDASLMMTATVWESEDVARIALDGNRDHDVGDDLRGPTAGCHLYRASDGWVAVCAVTPAEEAGLAALAAPAAPGALGTDDVSVAGVAAAVESMTVEAALTRLRAAGVPAAASVHPSAVPDDEQVRGRDILVEVRHPVAGRLSQVGIPLHLSVDVPAVKGPAPAPAPRPRTVR